jgi:Zn-dependent peptidase ImmA (M78 family)
MSDKEVDIILDEIDFSAKHRTDVNITAVIYRLGLTITRTKNLPLYISGIIRNKEISINITLPYFRQRFVLAHLLGHYMFHREIMFDGIDANEKLKNTFNPYIKLRHDLDATKFAASVLMPMDTIKSIAKELKVDDIKNLSFNNKKEIAKTLKVQYKVLEIMLESIK